MKAKRFIYIALASIIGMGFAGGCSDEDNPPYDPTINDPNYYDTIIYIDERTEEQKELVGGGGIMTFTEESFDGYRVIVTRKIDENNRSAHSYQIYIPADGADLNLKQDGCYWWYWTPDYMMLDNSKVEFKETIYDYIDATRYFYEKSTDYLTIRFDTPEEINFSIPENNTGKERKISVLVSNAFTGFSVLANMIFIQAGK